MTHVTDGVTVLDKAYEDALVQYQAGTPEKKKNVHLIYVLYILYLIIYIVYILYLTYICKVKSV